jgi:SAM-dependent methyltransferase
MTEASFLSSTRSGYDTIAEDYFIHFPRELPGHQVDRGMLAAFVDLVRDSGLGAVTDVGCGPGWLTDYFANSLGLNTFGIDLSPAMIAIARREFPGLRFEIGSMVELDLPSVSLGGVVAHYSIMHIPDEEIPGVFAGFHRVLAPGGHLLLAFQIGDEYRVRTEAHGHEVSIGYHLRPAERVAGWLRDAGFAMLATLSREIDAEWERAPRAFLLARKPASA